MHADFEVYGGALGLTCCCLYGGAPYPSQEARLKRGIDIVVGTPGRVKVSFYYIRIFNVGILAYVFMELIDFHQTLF